MEAPQKTKYRTAIWSSNYTPRYLAKENKNASSKIHVHPKVHSSIIYNRQDIETTQVSINGWVDKDVVYIHNGILLGHKKEGNFAISSNIDEPREY